MIYIVNYQKHYVKIINNQRLNIQIRQLTFFPESFSRNCSRGQNNTTNSNQHTKSSKSYVFKYFTIK